MMMMLMVKWTGAHLGVFASNKFTQFHDLVINAQSISLLDGIMSRPTLTSNHLTAAVLLPVVCVDTRDRYFLSFYESDRHRSRDNRR